MPKLTIDVEARIAQAADAISALTRQVESSSNKMERAFKNVQSAFTKGIIVEGVRRFGTAMFEATIQAEKAQQQLQATLQATGHAAGLTAKELDELAQKYSKTTLFDDDDIRQAEVALLRFRDVQSEVFEQAIQASLKLATAQGGTAAAAAQELGRALEDPINGLKALRSFMTPLTQAQKDLIEGFVRTGDRAAAAKVVIDQLNKSLGEAPNEGLAANANRATKAWDDFLKSLGRSRVVGGIAGDLLGTFSNNLDILNDELNDFARSEGREKYERFIAILKTITFGTALPQRRKVQDGFDDLSEGLDKFIAKQGEVRQKIEQTAEARRKAAEEEKLINAATAKAGHETAFAGAKQAAQIEQQELDDQLKNNLITFTRYYDKRAEIVARTTKAELDANQAAIDAVEERLAKTPEEKATKAAELIKLEAERVRLIKQEEADTRDLGRAHADESKKTIDTYNELKATLLELEGEYRKAADIRFEFEHRDQRQQLEQSGRSTEQIDRLKKINSAQADIRKTVEQMDDVYAELGRTEREIQDERLKGEITTLEAMYKTDAARKKAIADQKELIAQREHEVELAPTHENVQALKEAQQGLRDLEATSDEVSRSMREMFQGAFIDPFVDLVNKTKTADQALKSFFNNIAQALLRLEAQNIAEKIFGGGGGGGLLGLISGAGGFFAGGGSNLAAAQAGTSSGALANYFGYPHAQGGVFGPTGPVEQYAQGGVTMRPHVALFGEGTRPEAFVPLPDGRSIPVTIYGMDRRSRIQEGPSAITKRVPSLTETSIKLEVHPDVMHMTLRDWFEGELARSAATR